VALGFLLFGAIDLDRPDPGPWETLIARLVDAVAVDAQDPTAPAHVTPSPDGE
jgi:hypothetical protein